MSQYASHNPNVELDLQRFEAADDAGLSRQRRRAASRRQNVGVLPRLRHAALAVRRVFAPAGARLGLAALLFASSQAVFALPTGEQVAAGTASVSRPNAQTVQINQSSQKAILNWNTFSIGARETVNFLQPGASSVALNRVLGNNPSEIFGHLTATGQIFLVNPSGVLFGPGASIDVGGIAATTLGITDGNFLAGTYQFTNGGAAGSVVNQGTISAPGGYAALLGRTVTNDGLIAARLGTVALAAGDRVALDMVGDGLISVHVDQAALGAAVINKGTIQADGGNVILTARSADALLDTVVNNEGTIRAQSLVEKNGSIFLDGGNAGVVSVSGGLDASGVDAGTKGGEVRVLGDKVGLFGNATVNASGDAGGGTVLVGGNFQGKGPEANAYRTYVGKDVTINADAVASGDGGNVVVWADDVTRFYGTASAKGGAQSGDGGSIEISGKNSLAFAGFADASAQNGRPGSVLFDPKNITIANLGADAVATNDAFAENAANSVTFDADLITAITDGGTAVTLQANNDITINEAIVTNNGLGDSGALTLQAGRQILINASITTDNSAFAATANETVANGVDNTNRDAGNAVITMAPGTTINTGNKNISLTISTGPTPSDSGNITLAGLSTTGHVSVVNNGPTAGSSIVRADATQLITASSAALDVNGAGGGGSIGGSGAPIRVAVTNLVSLPINYET